MIGAILLNLDPFILLLVLAASPILLVPKLLAFDLLKGEGSSFF